VRTLTSLVIASMLCVGTLSCSGSGSPESCTPSGATQTVDLKDFAFEPTCIGAATGANLVLQNTGAATHTFTVDGTSINQSVDAGAGGEASLEGVAPGTYHVVCTLHAQMTATLVVS
jgi:plastocyanin